MSVLATGETIAEAIGPTLDKFVAASEPYLRKVSEELYVKLLWSVQDYLCENGQWNIGEEINRCRRIEHDNMLLRERNERLLEVMRGLTPIVERAESNASGTPEWENVSWRVKYFRTVMSEQSK